VPGIQQSAGHLQKELVELYRVRSEIMTQRERVAAGAAELVEKHKTLQALSARKSTQQLALAARSQEAEQRVAKLSQEAADLRELFAKLAEEKTRREAEEKRIAEQRAKEERERASNDGLLPAAPTTGRIVLKPPPGVEPIAPATLDSSSGKSFAQARGSMPYPVIGKLTSKYGEAADEGVMSKGIIITSRPESPVVAPFDGVVAFAGPFRGYGLLLIIEHSEGYHSLLAGMGRIDSAVGQRVLAGEPVGVMDSGESTSLYLELRRDGQPINPLPWLAARTGTSSG
jgi:septal ring factor EnvC (AmiA/AmiB activator)